MEFDFIPQLFEIVLLPLLSALTIFAVQWIRAKTNSLNATVDNETHKKYTEMLADTISKCVIATNQTYVDTLKAQGAFDETAQKVAFEKTYNAVLVVLTEDAKDYLTNIVGDFNAYLTQLIEAEVKGNK